MIRKLLFSAFVICGVNAFSQSTCTDPQGFIVPDLAVQTFPSTGGYYEFNAVSGCTYYFSHCQQGGSYTGDTYLIVTDDLNNFQAGNDDWCGLGSELTWNATFTGVARIHLGVCCGGTGTCSGGPTRVLAYWSSCAACTTAEPVTVSPVSPVCNSGDFTLVASSADPLSWFSTPNTGNPPLATGSTYNTGVISSTTSYWVASYDPDSACFGPPVEVIAEVQTPLTLTYSGDSTFCDNGDAFTPNFSPGGGTFTGTGIVNNEFDPATAGTGTHMVYYNADDACNSNDSVEFTVQAATTDPTLYACEDSTVVITGSGPGIGWYTSQLNNSLVDTGMVINYTLAQSITLFYGDMPPSFYIDTITATNITVSDHNTYTGDDRSGVAISQNYFYIVGDNNTGRIDLDFVGPWTSWPRRDGIFSDLQTGQLYTLWNGTTDPVGTFLGSDYTITHIAPMDEDLNIQSGSAIALSTPIVVNNSSGDFGIFAGSGMVIIWASQNQTFYQIDIMSGNVTTLGTGALTAQNTENIAFWGVAEIYNGDPSVTYRASGTQSINRFVIPSTSTMTVASFAGLSDMGCFTANPINNRFYFHHEYSSPSFGGTSETAGFCDLVLATSAGGPQVCRTGVPLIVSKPQLDLGLDTTICSNDPLTLDPGAGFDSYSWSTGETTQTISAANVGTYDVTVTDSLGCPNSDTINIDVNVVTEVDLGGDVTVCNYQLVVLNAGGGYVSYSWNTGESSQLIYVETDTLTIGNNTMTVTALDNNGCTTTDNMDIIVEDCAGLEESEMILLAYPNPVDDVLNIQLINADANASIVILDITGKIVSDQFSVKNGLMKIDMSKYTDGVYFVRVISGDTVQDVKVIKQ